MELELLKKIGLSDSQAKGYLALVAKGAMTPADLAKQINESRTNSYSIAERLVKLGLAKKTNQSNLTIAAENPSKIRALVNQQQQQIKTISNELGGILPALISKFRLTSDQPGVTTVEGTMALKLAYQEIINTKADLLIIPSTYDHDDPEISDLISQQIKQQYDAGILVRSLISSQFFDKLKSQQNDLLKFKRLPDGVSFQAQIMIFGDNVIITTFKATSMTTIITSQEITNTLSQLFHLIWDASSDE